MAARATFALKAGVWFRRGRLDMVSPDSQATACLLSGRNSTYRPVQISGAGSVRQDFSSTAQNNRNYSMLFEENVLRSIGEIDKAVFATNRRGHKGLYRLPNEIR